MWEEAHNLRNLVLNENAGHFVHKLLKFKDSNSNTLKIICNLS